MHQATANLCCCCTRYICKSLLLLNMTYVSFGRLLSLHTQAHAVTVPVGGNCITALCFTEALSFMQYLTNKCMSPFWLLVTNTIGLCLFLLLRRPLPSFFSASFFSEGLVLLLLLLALLNPLSLHLFLLRILRFKPFGLNWFDLCQILHL